MVSSRFVCLRDGIVPFVQGTPQTVGGVDPEVQTGGVRANAVGTHAAEHLQGPGRVAVARKPSGFDYAVQGSTHKRTRR